MSYHQRLGFFIVIDSCIVLVAVLAGNYLVSVSVADFNLPLMSLALFILFAHYMVALHFKLYKKIWAYASIGELWMILKIVSWVMLFTFLASSFWLQPVSYRFLIATWVLYLMFLGGSRFLWRIFRDQLMQQDTIKTKALIVGAGSAGTMVARQLLREPQSELNPVAFIDDDPRKHQLDIMGISVYGGVKDIPYTVDSLGIEHIIIAIPSLGPKNLNTIVQECAKTSARTKTLPLLEDLITGKVSFSQFRDVEVEDLLGRPPVDLDMASIADSITGKVVLITGGGGSIGSEIARQLIGFYPARLILLGHGENSIYQIEMELKETHRPTQVEVITEIAEIQDPLKMEEVMDAYKPDVIYHAAAHKHVPLMERSPDMAVKNNIIGTKNVALAACQANVKTFVMVSTDKAVNPTSVMGASKRLAEMVIQDIDKNSFTKFVAVRFGNVLGSRGSVIPLFKRQIEKGGPVTITHPDMIRYFMTIPEASRLVIQAGALAEGGEIFVLDMGAPVKIIDLAKNLIKLSGCKLQDISIEFTGTRPGEKLYEELLNDGELQDEQVHPKIYVGKTTDLYIEDIDHMIDHYHLYTPEKLKEELLLLANHEITKQTKNVITM